MQTKVRDLIEAFRDAATVLVNDYVARLESLATNASSDEKALAILEESRVLAAELRKLGLSAAIDENKDLFWPRSNEY